jgi:hypothetical protein
MERTELIRKGNEIFNTLKTNWSYATLKEASDCFMAADYQDGLFRIGDFLYYDRKLPLLAVTYYKKINNTRSRERLDEIFRRVVLAMRDLTKKEP